jgi:hypothetical protein
VGLKLALRCLQAGYWSRHDVHVGSYTPAIACVVAYWAGRLCGAARPGAGKRAPKDWIGPVHGILSICNGYTGVWAGMCGENPLGFGSDPEVLDGLSQRDGGSTTSLRR